MLPLIIIVVFLCSARQCVLVNAERNNDSQHVVTDETENASVHFKEYQVSEILDRLQKNEEKTKAMSDQLTEELLSQKLEIKMLHEKIERMQTSPRHDVPITLPKRKPTYLGTPVLGGDMDKPIRASDSGTLVVFTADMSKHLMHAGIGQTLIFDNVLLNKGNGYHAQTGVFSAPYDGYYVFSVTILSYQGVSASYHIYLDESVTCTLYVDGSRANSRDTSSKTVALYVRQNQNVTVRNMFADTHTHGDYHTSFTGFSLQTYGGSPSIVGK